MSGRNDACWCGSGRKWKKCHYPYPNPQAKQPQDITKEYFDKYEIIIKNQEQISGIRNACRLAASILDQLCKAAVEGISTGELNDIAAKLHDEAGAAAAPLHYGSPPFPKSICTSLNEVICHGIPGTEILKKGDILNIDVTSILNGYYGDCSRMVCVGEVTEEKKRVVDTAYECLMESIKILRPGIYIYEIGNVIEKIAQSKKCSVVNQFVGHGVGIEFHENPQIPHHFNHMAIKLIPGMTFTIEPMINAGVREAVIDRKDKWTARTKDGRPSAQWEHTILITPEGHEILTLTN